MKEDEILDYIIEWKWMKPETVCGERVADDHTTGMQTGSNHS